MSMSSIVSLTAGAAGNVPVAAPRQEAPQVPAPYVSAPQDQVVTAPRGRVGETAEPTQVERLLDSTTVAQLVAGKMKGGETVTISSDGKVVLEIKKDSVSALDKFRSFAGDALRATSAEVSNIVSQDPAFAFKESAMAVKSQVFSGIPSDFQTLAEKGFLPMIRVVALALDAKKAYDTFKTKETTTSDRFVDGAHVVTDVIGVGGAIAFALPAVGSSVATTMTVVGLVGDIAAYGYHVMKYFKDRGMAPPSDGSALRAQQQAAPPNAAPPAPNGAAPAVAA